MFCLTSFQTINLLILNYTSITLANAIINSMRGRTLSGPNCLSEANM